MGCLTNIILIIYLFILIISLVLYPIWRAIYIFCVGTRVYKAVIENEFYICTKTFKLFRKTSQGLKKQDIKEHPILKEFETHYMRSKHINNYWSGEEKELKRRINNYLEDERNRTK